MSEEIEHLQRCLRVERNDHQAAVYKLLATERERYDARVALIECRRKRNDLIVALERVAACCSCAACSKIASEILTKQKQKGNKKETKQ